MHATLHASAPQKLMRRERTRGRGALTSTGVRTWREKILCVEHTLQDIIVLDNGFQHQPAGFAGPLVCLCSDGGTSQARICRAVDGWASFRGSRPRSGSGADGGGEVG